MTRRAHQHGHPEVALAAAALLWAALIEAAWLMGVL